MKKHLSLLLCLVMLVSMFSVLTVQSSAAPAALVWDFTKPESSAELMGRNFTKVADTYLGAVRTNIAHTQPAGTGSVTYDAVNKAIVMGTPADGTDVTTMNPYFSSKVYDIAKTDYSYLKIRFKLETSLPKVTLNLRGVHASGKWSNDALYTDVPQEQWVEAVFPLKSWTTAYANYPKNASNFWGSTYILQFGKGSSAYFDDDFKFTLQYIGFFKTKAEADGFTVAPTVEMKYDSIFAYNDGRVHNDDRNPSYAANPNFGTQTGLMVFDHAVDSMYFKPDYSKESASTSNNQVARANFVSENVLLGNNYKYVKIRYKIEADGLTGPVSIRLRDGKYSNNDYVTKDSPVNEWVEVVHPLTASAWKDKIIIGPDPATQPLRVQLDWPTGVNVYDDPNFRFYVQYITFFTDKASADAYTYTPPAANGAPIIWNFDTHNAIPAYATDLTDAYVGAGAGVSTVVDFDRDTQSVSFTPNYSGTNGNIMRPTLYNTAAPIDGEAYPYVKVRYRLQCEASDSYVVYLRNNAWSINYIDKAAKNGDWVEVVVDMTADAQSTANRYWFNTGVTNCDDPSAAAKWGLLLQVENTSGAGKDNIHDDKNFRFDVQYIGFFSTKEEANAYTYTAPEVSAVPPVVMKFDTPNASSTITTETDYLSPFYASNILMGDKDANGNWPIGIMGYDAQERSIYFVNDAADNGKFPAAYMSRIYISSKNTAVQAEEYRYMKIRYKLVSDDPNVRVFLRDSKTWGSYDLFADRKTPVNEWVEVVVDLWRAGAGWNTKTLITPSNPLYLQFSNNNTSVDNYAKDDYRIYLQYISFFATEEEANAYTYTATDIGSLPNADDFLATDKVIVMPFDLPRYSYALGGNRYTSTYAIVAHSFGSDTNGAIKFDEQERAIYLEGIEPLATATQSRFVIRGSRAFSGADYPYVKLCYKITNYAFGPNDYLTFRNGSAWSTIQLSAEKLKADEWVTITANLNAMPGGSTWKSTVIGGNVGTSANDLRLQLYLNKPGANNITANPDARFYLKYIAFFQTQEEAENFDFSKWGKGGYAPESTGPDLWLQVLANKYSEKYTLTATATAGGAISNIGDTQVRYKKSMTYTITAAEGYTLTDVLVDGKSVGAVTEYTFESVKAAHTIHAVFTAKDGK